MPLLMINLRETLPLLMIRNHNNDTDVVDDTDVIANDTVIYRSISESVWALPYLVITYPYLEGALTSICDRTVGLPHA